MSFFDEMNQVWDAYLGQLERYLGQDPKKLLQPYCVSRSFPVDFIKYPKFSNGRCNREADLITGSGATFGLPDTAITLEDRYGGFLIALSKLLNFHHMTEAEKTEQKAREGDREAMRTALDNLENVIEARWQNHKSLHHIPSDEKEYLARDAFERKYDYYQERLQQKQDLDTADASVFAFILSMTSPENAAYQNALNYWQIDTDREAFPPSTGYENDPDMSRKWPLHRAQTISANWSSAPSVTSPYKD